MGKGRRSRGRRQRRPSSGWTKMTVFPEKKRYRIIVKGFDQEIRIDATSVDVSMDVAPYADITAFGDTNRTYIAGRRSWTIKVTE